MMFSNGMYVVYMHKIYCFSVICYSDKKLLCDAEKKKTGHLSCLTGGRNIGTRTQDLFNVTEAL